MENTLPIRTTSGYRMGDFEACGLPPRQSQQLLCLVNDLDASESAKLLGCSRASVYQYNDALRWAHNAKHQSGLIAAALKSGTLRLLSLLLTIFISTGATVDAPARFANHDMTGNDGSHSNSQTPLRFRSRPRRQNTQRNARLRSRSGRRDTFLIWNDERSELIEQAEAETCHA